MTPAALSRRRFLLGGLGALGAGALLPLVSGCAPGSPRALTMACGEPGGTYIRFGGQLADAVVRSGIADGMRAIETEGSVQNLELLRAGQVDLAIALADAVPDQSEGVVAIGRVYQNYVQCIVPAQVTQLSQLRGRTMSIGAPGSGTALTVRRVLDALGLLESGGVITREQRLADAVSGMGDGSLGGLFWSGGVPLPELARLDGVRSFDLLDLTPALEPLAASFPREYHLTAIPAGVYGMRESLPAIGVSNLLLARSDLPDDMVRALVDLLVDDAARLVPEPSVGVQFLTPSNLIDTGVVALHPAARQRYRERYG